MTAIIIDTPNRDHSEFVNAFDLVLSDLTDSYMVSNEKELRTNIRNAEKILNKKITDAMTPYAEDRRTLPKTRTDVIDVFVNKAFTWSELSDSNISPMARQVLEEIQNTVTCILETIVSTSDAGGYSAKKIVDKNSFIKELLNLTPSFDKSVHECSPLAIFDPQVLPQVYNDILTGESEPGAESQMMGILIKQIDYAEKVAGVLKNKFLATLSKAATIKTNESGLLVSISVKVWGYGAAMNLYEFREIKGGAK